MGPINYNIDVQTPFQAALQGYQAGAAIRDDRQKQAAMQAQQQQQQAMATDLRVLSMNPNATGADYAAMTTRYPQLSEQLTRSWGTLNDAQKQNNLNTGTQVYAAVSSGRPDVGADILKRQAEAKRNSGDERGALQDEAMATMLVEHPDIGRNMVGLSLSAIMGPDKFASTFGQINEEQRKQAQAPIDLAKAKAEAEIKGVEAGVAQEKADTEIANVRSQIDERAKRFGLDSDKLTSEYEYKLYELKQKAGEVPEYVAKGIEEATADAISSEQSASKMVTLADQLEKEGGGFGLAGSASEWIKKATGNQNEMSRLRSEYSRIVTPASMAAYKKLASGSTSDRDIDTAMKGVPPDTADAREMASFLRGTAKLQQYGAALSNAKSEWLGAVKNLGKAKADIEIDGVRVPAGTTFKNFSDQYLERKVAKMQVDQNAKKVQSRGYMRFAAPAAPAAAPAVAPPGTGPLLNGGD